MSSILFKFRLNDIIETVKKNSNLIDEVFKKHIKNPTIKELKIKSLKAFLKEISLQYNFDFVPSFDYINTKNSKLGGITFEMFKDNIFLWLSFQKTIYEKKYKKIQKKTSFIENDIKLEENVGLFLIFQQRSLFILKKKLELYKDKISQMYEKHSTNSKIPLNLFPQLINKILDICSFSFQKIESPLDIFDSEINKKSSSHKSFISKIIYFVYEKLNYYNELFRNKNENDDDEEVKFYPVDINTSKHKDNYDCFPDHIPLLYIDSTSLILAEFLFNNENYTIIDSNEEFSDELKILFDQELKDKITHLKNDKSKRAQKSLFF